MTLDHLNAADRDAAITGFVNDYVTIVAYALETFDPTRLRKMAVFCDHVVATDFPPLPILARVVGWTLFEMQWKTKTLHEQLTAEETEVHEAAWRISDAILGSRDCH
jgi:hypothetical protein